jgi:hypothetical protein
VKHHLPKGIHWFASGSTDRQKKPDDTPCIPRSIRVSSLAQFHDGSFCQNTSPDLKWDLPFKFFLFGTMTIPIGHQKAT